MANSNRLAVSCNASIHLLASLSYIIKMRFHDPGNVQPRADLDFLRANLAVVVFLLRRYIFKLDLVVHALARLIVIEAIQRILARMKATLAKFCSVLFIRFAFLKLEAAARHVLVKSLVVHLAHFVCPFSCCSAVRV